MSNAAIHKGIVLTTSMTRLANKTIKLCGWDLSLRNNCNPVVSSAASFWPLQPIAPHFPFHPLGPPWGTAVSSWEAVAGTFQETEMVSIYIEDVLGRAD